MPFNTLTFYEARRSAWNPIGFYFRMSETIPNTEMSN